MKRAGILLLLVCGCRLGERYLPISTAQDMAAEHVTDMATSPADIAGPTMTTSDLAVDAHDLASPIVHDLALPIHYDLAMPINDMATPWTCPNKGQACTSGSGACARTGTVTCTAQGVAACGAVAGNPDNSGTWHQAPAPNGSWDWDCDGAIEYQYPTGDTTAPLNPNNTTSCDSRSTQAACSAPDWYNVHNTLYPNPCGHDVATDVCYWGTNPSPGCTQETSSTVTEGCH